MPQSGCLGERASGVTQKPSARNWLLRALAQAVGLPVRAQVANDPRRYPDAKLLDNVSYDRFLNDHLGVMDSTAVALCRENGLPIRVFRMARGNIRSVCHGDLVGTSVTDKSE